MKFHKQPPVMVGVLLIGLGVFALLDLWWLLLPAVLLVGGVVGYQQRRSLGRTAEAVQVGLWCVGLALLFMFGFSWAGVLLLAGASVLMRGRESNVDVYVQNALAQARGRQRPAARPTPSQHVEITTSQPAPITPAQPRPIASENRPSTGDTTRL